MTFVATGLQKQSFSDSFQFRKNGSELKYQIIGIPPLLHVGRNTVRHNKHNTHIMRHKLRAPIKFFSKMSEN